MANSAFSPPALGNGAVSGANTASGNWSFGKNAIINGAFDTWQRGTSFAAIASGDFAADRWTYGKTSAAVHTVSRSTDVPTVAEAGILANYSLLADCTTADSSIAAGDITYVGQRIEGFVWRSFAQRALTLSFWVKATKTGTYCVALQNSGADRSFVAEYTVSSTNTWEKKTISITASPSAGTWDYTTGIGAKLYWMIDCGSTYHGSTGWNSASVFATANQVNGSDNIANDFRLALVQLEVGSVATDFEILDYATELARCQRYYQYGDGRWVFGAVGVTYAHHFQAAFSPKMRATPTMTRSDTSQVNVASVSAVSGDTGSYWWQVTATEAGNVTNYVSWTATSEI